MLSYGDKAEIAQLQAQGRTVDEIALELEADEATWLEIREFVQAREDDDARYEIVRFYAEHGPSVVTSGLTLEAAQAHCNDPETSWETATGAAAQAHFVKFGPWFDGYREM